MGESGFVVVDASVAFKWLVEEEHSDKAAALVRAWDEEGIQPAAPSLMPYEVANALHRRVVRGEIASEIATSLLEDLLAVGIALCEVSDIHVKALQLASRLKQSAVYDAYYLVLAESLDCEFWTADQRLYRAARTEIGNLRWLGDFVKRS